MIDLNSLIESLGLTQTAVAEKVGLTRQAISKIATGAAKPSIKTAKKLGELLNVDWTKFYD